VHVWLVLQGIVLSVPDYVWPVLGRWFPNALAVGTDLTRVKATVDSYGAPSDKQPHFA
jgi:hypothetical protein